MSETGEEDSGTFKPLVKLLVFTLLVPCSVTVWLPYWLFARRGEWEVVEVGSRAVVAMLSVVLGAAGYLWCGLDFAITGRGTPAPIDPPKTLVAKGLYRFVRNPMYGSVLLVLLGESLLFKSEVLLGYAATVWIGFHLFVVLHEEPNLKKKFGDGYRRYCEEVPRWMPKFSRKNRNHAL